MEIKEIMTVAVHSVTPDSTLRELRNIFAEVKYHHLLVVDGDNLVGVISDRDVLRMSSPTLDRVSLNDQDEAMLNCPARDFMSTNMIKARPDTFIDAAAIMLLEKNISCLPVVNNDQSVAGIVTWKDMLKYYVYVK